MRWIAIVCLVAACHPESQGRLAGAPIAPRPGDPIPPGGGPSIAVKVEAPEPGPPEPAAMVDGRRRGTPHASHIVAVVVSAAGDRALSRDALGGVRIWPTLDGTLEPRELPVQAPEAMAIAARSDGSLAAVIDATGTLQLIHLDREGMVRSVASLPPDLPFHGVVALDGGERVVAVRSDHRILLLDADGKELSRIGVRGARVVSLLPAGAASKDHLVAILRKAGETATFEVRRLALAGDGLAWTGAARELATPVATLPHVAAAVSPDGALLAYLAQAKDATEVRIVDVASGAPIALDGPATTTAPATTMLGWTGDRRVEMATFGGNGWRIDVTGKEATAISAANTAATSVAAFAPGLRVAGYQAHLAIQESDGDLSYLGYRDLYANTGALAPDGQSVAWLTATGAIVIQRFDGSADVRIKGANDYFGVAAIVDDRHVLAGRSNGQLVLFDSKTGAETDAMIASASTPWVTYEPSTRLAAVLRDAGTIWLIPVDPAADDPLGAPIPVSDGATSFTLLDPAIAGGDALMTFDAAQKLRRYSQDELADGLSAAELKRERVASAGSVWGFDRRGRRYLANGLEVEVRDGDRILATHKTSFGIHGVFPAPAGNRMLALVANQNGIASVRALDDKGAELWSASAPRGIFAASWSGDGSRAILQTQGGGVVVDGATGRRVATTSGWSFGRTTELPIASPANALPEFALPE